MNNNILAMLGMCFCNVAFSTGNFTGFVGRITPVSVKGLGEASSYLSRGGSFSSNIEPRVGEVAGPYDCRRMTGQSLRDLIEITRSKSFFVTTHFLGEHIFVPICAYAKNSHDRDSEYAWSEFMRSVRPNVELLRRVTQNENCRAILDEFARANPDLRFLVSDYLPDGNNTGESQTLIILKPYREAVETAAVSVFGKDILAQKYWPRVFALPLFIRPKVY
jgi:hypothetical protein